MDAQHEHLSEVAFYRLWKADLERYRSPKDAQLYRRTGNAIISDLWGDPCEWSAEVIADYLHGLTSANEKLHRYVLGLMCQWLVDKGYRQDNPLTEVPHRKRRRRAKIIREGLLPDELDRLIFAIAAGTGGPNTGRYEIARRRTALQALAQYYTGLRPGEICNIPVHYIHLDDGKPRVLIAAFGSWSPKNGDEREVPIPTRAREVFRELCHARVGRLSNLTERSYYEVVHAAARRAGLPGSKSFPYIFRHTYTSALIDAGVHEHTIIQLLGHHDTRSIEHYGKRNFAHKLEAVEQLP